MILSFLFSHGMFNGRLVLGVFFQIKVVVVCSSIHPSSTQYSSLLDFIHRRRRTRTRSLGRRTKRRVRGGGLLLRLLPSLLLLVHSCWFYCINWRGGNMEALAKFYRLNSTYKSSCLSLILRSLQEFHTQKIRGDAGMDYMKIMENGFFAAILATPSANYFENVMVRVCGERSVLGRLMFTNLVTFPCLVVLSFSYQIWQVNRGKTISYADAQEQLLQNVKLGLLPALQNVWLYMVPMSFVVQNTLPRSLWIPTYEFLSFFIGIALKHFSVLRFGKGSIDKDA